MESVLAMHNKKASITHEAKMLKDKKISTAGLTPKEQEKKNITWIGKNIEHFILFIVIGAKRQLHYSTRHYSPEVQ